MKRNVFRSVTLALFCMAAECHADADRTASIGTESQAAIAVQAKTSKRPLLIELPAPVAKMSGIACHQKRADWAMTCETGDLEISIYSDGCDQDGRYGQVLSENHTLVMLLDRFPAKDAIPNARVHDKQLGCITATAYRGNSQSPEWYYVTAIPAHTIKACAGVPLCEEAGDQPIQWTQPATRQPCHRDANEKYAGDCASGWVSTKDFFEFPMGL
jgi:hypothetical protein